MRGGHQRGRGDAPVAALLEEAQIRSRISSVPILAMVGTEGSERGPMPSGRRIAEAHVTERSPAVEGGRHAASASVHAASFTASCLCARAPGCRAAFAHATPGCPRSPFNSAKTTTIGVAPTVTMGPSGDIAAVRALKGVVHADVRQAGSLSSTEEDFEVHPQRIRTELSRIDASGKGPSAPKRRSAPAGRRIDFLLPTAPRPAMDSAGDAVVGWEHFAEHDPRAHLRRHRPRSEDRRPRERGGGTAGHVHANRERPLHRRGLSHLVLRRRRRICGERPFAYIFKPWHLQRLRHRGRPGWATQRRWLRGDRAVADDRLAREQTRHLARRGALDRLLELHLDLACRPGSAVCATRQGTRRPRERTFTWSTRAPPRRSVTSRTATVRVSSASREPTVTVFATASVASTYSGSPPPDPEPVALTDRDERCRR